MAIENRRSLTLIHRSDVRFEKKKSPINGTYIQVYDGDGSEAFKLPGTLTIRQAGQILDLINEAYELGHQSGGQSRGRELARLMGIKPECFIEGA